MQNENTTVGGELPEGTSLINGVDGGQREGHGRVEDTAGDCTSSVTTFKTLQNTAQKLIKNV